MVFAGGIFLVFFLIVAIPVVGLIFFVARKRRGKMDHLASVIAGQVTNTGVTGVYADRQVRGQPWVHYAHHGAQRHGDSYRWVTSMQAPYGVDFRVVRGGPQGFAIECADPRYAGRLQEMGMLSAVAQVPDLAAGKLEFSCSGGWLTLVRTFHTNLSLPDPQTFQNDLEVLRYLAQFC